MDDDEQVELREGMSVASEEGAQLGTLSALLIPDEEDGEEGEAEFLVVKAQGAEHLVPFEAVLGVEDDTLVLDVDADVLPRYPAIKADSEPSDSDIETAYQVYDETAKYADLEDDA